MPGREARVDPVLQTQNWVSRFVIDLNLCPFAAREWHRESIRFRHTELSDVVGLLMVMEDEIQYLKVHSEVETSLLIVSGLRDDFNQFIDLAYLCEELIAESGHEEFVQLASFHPHYQFDHSSVDDPANYTNRAPWPVLHLLRVESVARAIEHYPDTDMVPHRNVQLLRKMGCSQILEILSACQKDA